MNAARPESIQSDYGPHESSAICLSPETEAAVKRLLSEHHVRYAYPWNELDDDRTHNDAGQLALVGYGSLMNSESSARTIRRASDCHGIPVIAFGVQRVYNYRMPKRVDERYGAPADPLARAALNVYRTDQFSDQINGILVQIELGDVPALREREIAYDLEPVVCVAWGEPRSTPFLAYILACPDTLWMGEQYTDDRLTPHLVYDQLCRAGAQAVSEEFVRFFLNTTLLSDRRTPLARWMSGR